MTDMKSAKPSRARRSRAKCSPGTTKAAAKDAIAQAAAQLGGPERMAAWVKEDPKNEATFWSSIYPKLIPVQLSGEGGGPIEHGLTIRFV